MPKRLFLLIAIGSLGLVGRLLAQDYKPALCGSALPYEGAPLYGKRVELPSDSRFVAGALDAIAARRLELALDTAMAQTGATNLGASVVTRETMWSATRSPQGTVPPRRFYWASVGKAFTAVVIMQLVDEGKIKLGDPVSRWLPELPQGKLTTIDHLLLHTSGLFSANEDAEFRRAPRYLTPVESIQIAIKHGAMFCPGQAWRYSNTGYTILGQVIEAIEGRPYHEVVNRRISERLGLSTLRALGPLDSPADLAPLTPADGSKPMSPSSAYAAGAMVGSTDDMLRFWHALLTKQLLSAESTSRMFEHLYPMFDKGTYYGRGVMLYVVPDRNGGTKTWIGHSGGTPGAKAVVVYSPTDRAFVAVALTGDGSVEATANLLLTQLAEPK